MLCENRTQHARTQAGRTKAKTREKKKKKSQVKIPMLREKEKGKGWVRSDVPPSFEKTFAPRHIFYHCHYCSLKNTPASSYLSPWYFVRFPFSNEQVAVPVPTLVRPSVRQKLPIPKLQSPF